jgi:predicted nucleic acid-binding protein
VSHYLALDTSVFSYLTKPHPNSIFYLNLAGTRELAISFQVGAELLASGYSGRRLSRLQQLQAAAVYLPHSHATSSYYAEATLVRKALRRSTRAGRDAGDADLWIIASAIEHSIPLASQDAQQVALARAMGVDAYTALPRLRAGNPSR